MLKPYQVEIYWENKCDVERRFASTERGWRRIVNDVVMNRPLNSRIEKVEVWKDGQLVWRY